ncbi:MAG: type II toxin-antitoxin system HigB family toxin [Planctomycetaceae bacterium]
MTARSRNTSPCCPREGATIAVVSLAGNCVVFDIGGNEYRLVTRIVYRRLGRPLEWDPAAERFGSDSEADALLSRPQRQGFEVQA